MAEPVLSEAYRLLDGVGLVRDFPSGDAVVHVLRGVDLAVAEGTIVAVTGRSGAGKTTLLNVLGGLDRATSGQVRIDGVDVGTMDEGALHPPPPPDRGLRVPGAQPRPDPVRRRERGDPPAAAPCRGSERDERVAAALDDVGLLPRAGHRPGELSGGEQQRVAIARALVGRPRLLLADEPTAQLDHDTSRSIASLLRRRVELDGLTIVLASHDPVLLAIADEVYELREGRLEATDRPDR